MPYNLLKFDDALRSYILMLLCFLKILLVPQSENKKGQELEFRMNFNAD